MQKPTRMLAVIGLGVGVILVVMWQSGALDGLTQWAAARQREAQNLMAGALRALRAGEPGATATLMLVCFGYGFAHAVGPGHGKVLIGGYGLGTQVAFARLASLSVLASLAQALTAVILVWAGLTIFDLSREALTGLSENIMADVSAAMIMAVGLWLAWRGILQLLRAERGVTKGHDNHHHHHHDENCGCGHSHGPSIEEVTKTRSIRDAVILIAGIAARPCTGAVFLLLLTWRMGIFPTGILATFAMGLGTASVSLVVAGLSIWARNGSFALVSPDGRFAAIMKWLPGTMQLIAGATIAFVAFGLLI